MLHQTDGLSLQSPLRPLSVLLFHLLLIHSCRGQSQLIGSSQPIVATLGDDIILPCHLEPAEDALGLTLEWTRPDLNRRFVYVRRSGQELVGKKHESFEGRTSLFIDELKMGNISLKLSKVTLADQGTYRCFIPLLGLETLVQLAAVSGAVSSPVITLAGIDEATSGVILQCESAGWYPEPEVLWLDGEGKLVSVGPTETVRGPDDLYTVSSRVTVETRHGNSFTCRVQQQNINQTRETHIHVPDDFFKVQSSSSPVTFVLAVSLAVCIVFSSAVVFFVCKWRQKIKTKRSRSEETLVGTQQPSPHEREKHYMDTNLKMEGNRAAPASSSWLTSWNLYKWFKDEHQRRVESETKLKDEKQKSENQLKTKNQELQEETTRREEAEEEVKKLKTELQTKVDSLKDVQKLKEEKVKSENQLKNQLKTKNKELQEETTRREEAEKQVEKLKTELQTKVESLKDVQKLKEEKVKSEKQLETKNKELQEETTRREEAEKQVEKLKTELQTKQDNSSSSSLRTRGKFQ